MGNERRQRATRIAISSARNKMNIETIIDDILKNEGGYANNKNDRGGETNFGITIKVARENGYLDDMKHMPAATARNIYSNIYIEKPGFHLILAINEDVASELIDTGVNMGVNVAGKFLQRCLNVLQSTILAVDGVCGPATRAALASFLSHRPDDGAKVLLKMLNCLQGARYIELAEAREKNKSFVFGWFRTRIAL